MKTGQNFLGPSSSAAAEPQQPELHFFSGTCAGISRKPGLLRSSQRKIAPTIIAPQKAAKARAIVNFQPSTAQVRTSVWGLTSGEASRKLVTVPRSVPLRRRPSAIGMVAQEQPGITMPNTEALAIESQPPPRCF